MPLCETVTDLTTARASLARRRYGVIEVVGGQFVRVRLRPWPKIVSVPGILLLGGWYHRHARGDRVWLYYNQPWRFSNFLVAKYVVSSQAASLRSLKGALEALDEIARIKHSDALLCDVANWRIGPRLLARAGWAPHCPSRWHRHYIKRFYGAYPEKGMTNVECLNVE